MNREEIEKIKDELIDMTMSCDADEAKSSLLSIIRLAKLNSDKLTQIAAEELLSSINKCN